MNFTFPENIDNFHHSSGIVHLEQMLKEENLVLSSNIMYRCSIKKQKYMYANCRYNKCSAFLAYRLNEEESFALSRYNSTHSHTALGSKATFYRQIEEDINDLPITVSITTAKQIICNKYRIKHDCFYYLFRKVKNRKITFSELTNMLNGKNYDIQSDPYYYDMNELPDLLVVVTPLMKENYKLYGHWVGFDLTFNLIQEKNKDGRTWKVGIFTGISSSKKIVPFGLVICNEETTERFVQIVKAFTDMTNKIPDVIITDEDTAFLSAIDTLRAKR